MCSHKAAKTQKHKNFFFLVLPGLLIPLLLAGCNFPGYGAETPPALSSSQAAPTQTPGDAPVLAATPDGPYIQITGITLDAQGHYVAEYQTFNFTPQVPGMHLHFFFDIDHPDKGGSPGSWIVYGGPSPFLGYFQSDRPDGAAQLCALVANPDHSMIENSGNCAALP
jgi:hypothetical protein